MKIKRVNQLNEKVEISASEIKQIFKNGETVHRGLTDVKVKNNVLMISHSGNMGNNITRNVDPNIERLGLPKISELKKQYKVISEDGSPDYLYTIKFDLSKELNESKLNEGVTEEESMTVGKLKKLLESYSEDMLVAIYCWEDGDFASALTTNKEEELYYKGDSPEDIYGTDPDEEYLVIKGISMN